MSDPRSAAARAVCEVLGRGRSLADTLPPAQAKVRPADRGLVQALAYGTLRWLPRLQALLGRLLDKPLKAKDRDVECLLLVGLYQLDRGGMAEHAAVSETVAAARRLRRPWAGGLANAVLRRFQREREALVPAVEQEPTARHAHPGWLLQALSDAWPEQAEAIMAANNAHPPMTLRVNRRQGTREAYLRRLGEAGIAAAAHRHAPDAVILEQPCPVDALPGFAEGAVSVQDAAAQLAATLVAPAPGERILDACAAPGGKTSHLLELCPEARVTALDVDPQRLERVRENLGRLGLAAAVVAGDAGDPQAWWDGKPFDRILLDAPCSATGVIRRHPDIKALRRPDDITALAGTQEKLLRSAWSLLKPGGLLVYATCSVLPQENAGRIAAFLAHADDARLRSLTADWGVDAAPGRQILPGQDAMDGFFYACLDKQ